MEILILLIIGVVIYVVVNNNNNKSNRTKTPEIKVSVTANSLNDYEEPFDGRSLNSRDSEHEIFRVSYPFFFALNDKNFQREITEELTHLTHSLSIIKDEDIQGAIIKLIEQEYFRTKSGLPKYLQMIPIQKFINSGIFIEPNESHKETLFESMTMKELRNKCDEIGISAARSKTETVTRLMDSDKDLLLDYQQYFMINPNVKKLYEFFDNYCIEYLNKSFNKNKIKLTDINHKLYQDDLLESEEIDNFKIQVYGYASIILFKNDKPLFRIFGFNLNDYGSRAILLKNGIVLLNNQKWLGRSRMNLIVLINEKKEELFKIRLKNPLPNGIKKIPDQSFVYCSMKDDSIWFLNTETFENKFLENPENKNIYSLLDEF